ncbi:MAG: hypothetical protein U5J83_08770 [Bryobacterales bacterium]|nr:hypothetical protein [Bryobacterales bacterium]
MADEANELAESQLPPSPPCDAAEVRGHLRRILDSPHFIHAHQLQHFLDHLVTSALEGRSDDLKEYSLGRDVFRRGESYDPRNDAIVRVQASILRKRLAAYYENGGSGEAMRIELHKGSYVPHFVFGGTGPAHSKLEASPSPAQSQAAPASRRELLKIAAGFAAGAAVATGAWVVTAKSSAPALAFEDGGALSFPAREVSPRIWGPLLSGEHPIQLAFGCPQFFRGGGLYVRDVNVNNTQEEAADRKLRELTRQLGLYLAPAPNTYTGVGEILGIYRMTQFVTHQGMESNLENVQLLTPELIRNKNLILVSSYRFRTLLELLSLPQAFSAEYMGGGAIVPLEPRPNEQKRYGPIGSGGVSRSYGLVSYWTRPETGGRILLMSGIESWATQGTVMYITGETYLRDLERLLSPAFNEESRGVQILVEIEGRDDRAINVSYVTHRVL